MAGQRRTEGCEPPVPPTATPDDAPPRQHDIPRSIITMRQMGAYKFKGVEDILGATYWLEDILDKLDLLELDDSDKVIIVRHFLEGHALNWWNYLKITSAVPGSWSEFVEKFQGHYISYVLRTQRNQEFLDLKQENLSVTEYKLKFLELLRFAPIYPRDAEFLCRKFLEGLNHDIYEKMTLCDEYSDLEKLVEIALAFENLIIKQQNGEQHNPDEEHHNSNGRFSKKGHYISYVLRTQKSQEFLDLKQENLSVTEYKLKFLELPPHAPSYPSDAEFLCRKFLEGLNHDIYKQMALCGEYSDWEKLAVIALVFENLIKQQNGEQHNSDEEHHNSDGRFSKKRKAGGNIPWCQSCTSYHSGPCEDSRVCYNCSKPGHIKLYCPELEQSSMIHQPRY